MKNLKPVGSERLRDFIFMEPSYDPSQEVDEPQATESKRSSAVMDQNTSGIKFNQVMITGIFQNMRSRLNLFVHVFQVMKTEQLM